MNSRMVGDFGAIAWPARHDCAGVKTFILRHRGVAYERDLGPDTDRIVRRITALDPGERWTRVAG